MRDGQLVGEYEIAKLPRLEMVGLMIGKDPEEVAAMENHKISTACTDIPVLLVDKLDRKGVFSLP